MIDRRTRPNWKLVHVPNRVYMNPNSRTRQRIFLPGIAHLVTEGMCEKHGHPYEFQIVIDAPLRDMANILAEFCCRVRAGYQFEPGDVLDDILADGALVRLDLHVDLQFRPVLRVVFQDGQDRWPRMRSVATDATCRMCRHRCCCIRIFGERKIERIKLEEELQHV